MAKIVIAPDSFKSTATAAQVADAIATGWAKQRPTDELVKVPLADGGEGTVAAMTAAYNSINERRDEPPELIQTNVTGPVDDLVRAEWLLLPDGTAVIELASSSGLALLSDQLQPGKAHTFGLGQTVAAALDRGATKIFIGLGGSSSTDGGAAALQALGAQLLDESGQPIEHGGEHLVELASVDLIDVRQLPAGGIVLLTDVTNPLLGEQGAAAVYGPQKGADEHCIQLLNDGLQRFAQLTSPDLAEQPGAGAAGGTAFGFLLLGAEIQPGALAIAAELKLSEQIETADLVITGEGRFDRQSTRGKAPGQVLELAQGHGVPADLIAGSIADSAHSDGFANQIDLSTLAESTEQAQADPQRWLEAAGAELARNWQP